VALAALLWALQIVQVRGHRWEGSPLSLAPWQFAVAVCLLAPAALIFEHGHGIRWSPALGLILLYNGPVATAFAFWAVLTVTRALPAVTTSLGTLGVPITGMLLSSLVLGEPLTATNVSGLVLLIAGLAMVALAERRGGGGGSGR